MPPVRVAVSVDKRSVTIRYKTSVLFLFLKVKISELHELRPIIVRHVVFASPVVVTDWLA